jgi:hypothetical protein
MTTDNIGINNMTESEAREDQGITSDQTKILTEDPDFNFQS